MSIVEVPWTQEFANDLNKYQVAGWMHPYTCPNKSDGNHQEEEFLIATTLGWVCLSCNYKQTWAHDFTVGDKP